MTKLAIWCCGLLLSYTLTTSFAQASTAQEIVDALDYDSYYDSLSSAMVDSVVEKMIANGRLKKDTAVKFKNELTQESAAYKDVYLKHLADFFSSRFNEQQLAEINAFYRSQTGRQLNRLQKDLRDNLGDALQQFGLMLGAAAAQRLDAEKNPTP